MKRLGATVLGTFIDALDWSSAVASIRDWAAKRESRVVCCCNVHSVVSADGDPRFGEALARADMVTADGAPIAWMLRRLGYPAQERIAGPDLMWKCCEVAAQSDNAVFLYGSSPESLSALQRHLQQAFPTLLIAGAISPPYRELAVDEDAKTIAAVNDSGATLVFVSLGCPKQELWMAAHRERIHAVMIGVGAAFDYHAGTLGRPPAWARRIGLEWSYRLAAEPRRLWKRYLITNTLFIMRAARQLAFRSSAAKPRRPAA